MQPGAAWCQTAPDIDGIDFEPGETELELETRFIDFREGTGVEFQLQAEQGLSDRWALGGELEFEREPGEPLRADAALARLKWRAPGLRNGVAFALQAGAGYAVQDDAAIVEAAAFVGWGSDSWSFSGKIGMEQLLEEAAAAEFGYRLRIKRELGSDLAIGAESAGDLWAGEEAGHRVGPFIELPLGGGDAPVLELGAFAGLSAATPKMQFRVEIEFEF